MPDKTPVPFEKRELVCKNALQKNTDAIMTGYVGSSQKNGVLSYPHMGEMDGLHEDVEMPCCGRLYFREFPLEVFNEELLQAAIQLDWFLSYYLETLVKHFQIFVGHKRPRL